MTENELFHHICSMAEILHMYTTVPFPDGIGDSRFTYAFTVLPFLEPGLGNIQFLGETLPIFMVIRITEAERDFAVRERSRNLVDELPDALETWLIDGDRSSAKWHAAAAQPARVADANATQSPGRGRGGDGIEPRLTPGFARWR